MSEFAITLLVAAATCVVTLTVTKIFDLVWTKVKKKNNEVRIQASHCEERFHGISEAEGRLEGKLDDVMRYLQELKANGPEEYQVLKKGVQAILRRDMQTEYREAQQKKYATLQEKQNFDNMYNAYHNLGENGVMDGVHEEYMRMPTEKPVRKTTKKTTE